MSNAYLQLIATSLNETCKIIKDYDIDKLFIFHIQALFSQNYILLLAKVLLLSKEKVICWHLPLPKFDVGRSQSTTINGYVSTTALPFWYAGYKTTYLTVLKGHANNKTVTTVSH